MKRRLWKKLDAEYARFPRARGTSATEEEIHEAERAIGCTFDDDYREFLRRYGSGLVGPDMIFGVHPAPMRPHDWSVVDETRRYRAEGWPGVDRWYVMSTDGSGNPIGMDDESRVWVCDHDFGGVQQLAKSFEGYVQYLFKLAES